MADFTGDVTAGSMAQVDAKSKLSINLTFVSLALGIPRPFLTQLACLSHF